MNIEKNNKHIAKYGGHTCTDYTKVIELVLLKKPKYITVSAPGKMQGFSEKITDKLIELSKKMLAHEYWEEIWTDIIYHYNSALSNTKTSIDFNSLFISVKEGIGTHPNQEYISVQGEYISAKIITALLVEKGIEAQFVDASKLFFFDEKGILDYEKTTSSILKECGKLSGYIIIPGFYGTAFDGTIKSFPRGGSDITGVLIAAALNIPYIKWTNTGVCTADPGKVPAVQHVPDITFKEIRLLAYSGADILQKDVIPYLLRGNIEMTVCSMHEPEHPGTKIIPCRKEGDKSIKAVSGKTDFTLIMIEKAFMSTEVGSTMEILAVLKEAKIPYDQDVPCVDSWCLSVDDEYLPKDEQVTQELLTKLRSVSDAVSVEQNLSVLFGICPTVDCNHIKQSCQNLLYKKEITIFAESMIFSGGTDNMAQIMYMVKNSDFKEAYNTMHSAFLWRRA